MLLVSDDGGQVVDVGTGVVVAGSDGHDRHSSLVVFRCAHCQRRRALVVVNQGGSDNVIALIVGDSGVGYSGCTHSVCCAHDADVKLCWCVTKTRCQNGWCVQMYIRLRAAALDR
jgi:hypothetical protein